jgi:hypothetical protein
MANRIKYSENTIMLLDRRIKMGKEDEIRLIAYSIWEQEGSRDGHDYEHWIRAEAIWEEKQNQSAVSRGIKTESKQVTKQNPKDKKAKKKS